ncbi:MAG: 2TM domain-containing protein, partial [Paracoccaceae bacterium]
SFWAAFGWGISLLCHGLGVFQSLTSSETLGK